MSIKERKIKIQAEINLLNVAKWAAFVLVIGISGGTGYYVGNRTGFDAGIESKTEVIQTMQESGDSLQAQNIFYARQIHEICEAIRERPWPKRPRVEDARLYCGPEYH